MITFSRFRALTLLSTMLSAVVFPVATNATGPVFNGQPNDYPTLQVAKLGDNAWHSSVSATAGDTLSLLVWDHNSVPDTVAHNVRVKVTLPSSDFTNAHPVSASISADNAATVTGAVNINSVDLTSLSYIAGSPKLYKNSGGENPTLVETSWPQGVNPDNLITTGVNLGDQNGCWQYAKAIILQVKLTGQEVQHKAVLKIAKDDRRTANDPYSERSTVNPGDRVEYRIVIENIDELGVAFNLRLQDFLPAGVTYVSATGKLTKPNGDVVTLADGVTNGMVILSQLKPHEKAYFNFLADTVNTFTDGQCVVNRAKISADNATNSPEDTADICFVVKVQPTPTPTPTPPHPTPTPQPRMPATGPEGSLLASIALSGFGLTTGRYAWMKRKLKRQARSIDIA